jgi:hypothetical protein
MAKFQKKIKETNRFMAKFLPNPKISIDDNNNKKHVEFSVETQIEFEEAKLILSGSF